MRIVPLDKILDQNTDYTCERYRGLVIKSIGTDDTAEVTVKIDGKNTTTLIDKIAYIHKTSSYLFDPADLKTLFLVVPPDITLHCAGTAGKFTRIRGDMYLLEPGESLPADLLSRYEAQPDHKYKLYRPATVGTGTSWADKAEIALWDVTPTSIETLTLNHRVGIEIVAAGSPVATDGQVGVRFKLDGAYLDNLESATARLGIDLHYFPMPPTDTTNMMGFTFCEHPITINPDINFQVIARNVSGGVLFATTQAQYRWYALVEYKKSGE